MENDHLNYARKHLYSQDEKRYVRANAHALVGIGLELRRLNSLLERLLDSEMIEMLREHEPSYRRPGES